MSALALDARQRAMLDEMGVKVWWPAEVAVRAGAVAPAVVAEAGASVAPTAPPAPVAATSVLRCVPAQAATILTVDDDDLVRMTTVEMLEDLGYSVTAARSGAEALKLLEEGCVDLVITDHAMPQMTGAQLAATLHERYPTLPVIMATGYADLPAGQPLGLPRLAKPYSQQSLADIVARTMPRPEQPGT